ncbi:MAG: hypothetical protein JST39_12840, partial [Bacteroidetes bacterium]|nr:hypothetical protein [Bacteroidota bacterium]
HLTLRALHLYGGYAWYSMAIPVTYVVAALALTEMPAMLFFSLSLYLSVRASRSGSLPLVLACALGGGLCMSLAIIGRQPYLLTLPAVSFLYLLNSNHRNRWPPVLLFIAVSLLLPLYIFYIWQGLVPPGDAKVYSDLATQGISIRPGFGLLCLAYFAVCMLIIAPGLYRLPSRREGAIWTGIFVGILAANLFFDWMPWLPLEGIVRRWITSPTLLHIVASISGAAMVLFSFFFMVSAARRLFDKKRQPESIAFFLALLAIALACIKITWGFSSRYAAQAIPLLLLLGGYFREQSPWRIPRVLAGIALGLVSLLMYLTL